MAKTSDVILAVAVVGGAYLLWRTFQQKPWSKEQTVSAINAAGGNTYSTPSGTFWSVPGGSVKLDQGFSPNFAQSVLVGIDRIVPGDWLTRKVFGI